MNNICSAVDILIYDKSQKTGIDYPYHTIRCTSIMDAIACLSKRIPAGYIPSYEQARNIFNDYGYIAVCELPID